VFYHYMLYNTFVICEHFFFFFSTSYYPKSHFIIQWFCQIKYTWEWQVENVCLYDYFFKFLSLVTFTVFHIFSNHFNSKKNYSLLFLFLLHQNHFHFQINTQLKKKKRRERRRRIHRRGDTWRIHERNKKNYTGQWFDPLHCSSLSSILGIWFPFLFFK
jgi:hypothetical protein